MIKLRPHQEEHSTLWVELLKKHKIVYFAHEVRTWKTITSLETCKKFWANKVLFITKLKAISSIKADYQHYTKFFNITIINYQSVHKIESRDFDLMILDEAHWLIAGFPKPSKVNKQIKKDFWHLPIIYLSGTPLIESAAKAFPAFNISQYSPFLPCKNFYRWFDTYGIPKQIKTSYGFAHDYSNTKYDMIMDKIQHLILTFTQKQAWFTTSITEHVLEVEMKEKTYSLIKRLIKDRVIPWKSDAIIADTWVRLQSLLLQMFSWTVKLESWKAITIDDSKWVFIKNYFKWKRIAILTCFIQEVILLKQIFWDTITDDLEEFKATNKNYVWNVVANKEWVSLKEAEALIFYNVPYSGTSWTQWKDRMSYKWRKENNVYIICAKNGIEKEVLKIVRKKQTFSKKIFNLNLKNQSFWI